MINYKQSAKGVLLKDLQTNKTKLRQKFFPVNFASHNLSSYWKLSKFELLRIPNDEFYANQFWILTDELAMK